MRSQVPSSWCNSLLWSILELGHFIHLDTQTKLTASGKGTTTAFKDILASQLAVCSASSINHGQAKAAPALHSAGVSLLAGTDSSISPGDRERNFIRRHTSRRRDDWPASRSASAAQQPSTGGAQASGDQPLCVYLLFRGLHTY